MQLTVLDLFSGVGGFSLGLERAGMRTVAFCERDRFCRAVLANRWPGVASFRDVRFLTADKLRRLQPIHVVCGGFPCQDISRAGKGAGIEGEQSGQWREFYRIVGELRPLYAVVENVAALLDRGIERVLGDLAALGYDAEWHCIPAAYVGARHIRDRVWIIAYPRGHGLEGPILTRNSIEAAGVAFDWSAPDRVHEQVDWLGWQAESAFLGTGDDVPYWMDRINALGNSLTPQIPEIIGRAIMSSLTA